MKRLTSFLLICLFTLCLSACSLGLKVPKGYIRSETAYDTKGFQDYTDYCKYYYRDKSAFEKDARYSRISAANVAAVSGYFANFHSWMGAAGRAGDYDFNMNCISDSDYVLVETKEGTPIGDSVYGKYDNYSVYFFDADSCVLYYIHSTI